MPVPEVVHVEEVALPPVVPDKVKLLPAQIVSFAPAFTVATGFIVNTMRSFEAGQGPAGSFVVNVKETDPEIISAAEAE